MLPFHKDYRLLEDLEADQSQSVAAGLLPTPLFDFKAVQACLDAIREGQLDSACLGKLRGTRFYGNLAKGEWPDSVQELASRMESNDNIRRAFRQVAKERGFDLDSADLAGRYEDFKQDALANALLAGHLDSDEFARLKPAVYFHILCQTLAHIPSLGPASRVNPKGWWPHWGKDLRSWIYRRINVEWGLPQDDRRRLADVRPMPQSEDGKQWEPAAPDAVEASDKRRRQDQMAAEFDKLSAAERHILQRRRIDQPPGEWQEIAKELKLSVEEVLKKHRQALAKLRDALSRLSDEDLDGGMSL